MNKIQLQQLKVDILAIKDRYEGILNTTKADAGLYQHFKAELLHIKQLLQRCTQAYEAGMGGNNPCKDCDSFRYLIDYDFANLWKVSVHFKLNYGDLVALNPHLIPEQMSKGAIICLPKGTLAGAQQNGSTTNTTGTVASSDDFAGNPNGSKLVLVSWTFDDGPVKNTDVLKGKINLDHGTWFIVKSNMLRGDGWAANVARYLEFQKNGGTVGIHAQHKDIDHILWFPATVGAKYKAYASIELAMSELRSFKSELNNAGLTPKFVRLPGGLASQLASYAKHFGFTDTRVVRNGVLDGLPYSSLSNVGGTAWQYNKIVKDYTYFKQELESMSLLLWSGTAKPDTIAAESWQATSSGDKSMTDTATSHVTYESSRDAYHAKKAGHFEKLVQGMKAGETRSMVILAHDTSDVHINEVLEDKRVMEAYAARNDTKIQYVNMDELFTKITGKNAKNYTPDY